MSDNLPGGGGQFISSPDPYKAAASAQQAPGERSDHEHCPCVDRLRAQNKRSADEWSLRCADMQSELHGLRELMSRAVQLNNGGSGLSTYGKAALAVALKEADEANAQLDALRDALYKARRAQRAAVEREVSARLSEWKMRRVGWWHPPCGWQHWGEPIERRHDCAFKTPLVEVFHRDSPWSPKAPAPLAPVDPPTIPTRSAE